MKNFSRVSIVCDQSLTLRYLYYCNLVWKFKKIKISETLDCDFSNVILIDRNSLSKIKISKKLRNFKIIICLWNGMFDFEESRVIFFLNKFKNKNIKLNYFLVGYMDEYKKKKDIFFSENLKKKAGNCFVYCNLKYKFIYEYSNLYYLTRVIKYPLSFLKYFFQKKIIFIGSGIINNEIINNLKKDHSYKLFKIINDFYKIFYIQKNYKKGIIFLKNLIYSKVFIELESFKKLYIFQTIARCIIIHNLKKYKNFQYYNREYRMGLMRCGIYRNNIFLDLGSKCGLEKVYDRSLLLYKNHNNNFIKIDLFKGKTNFVNSFKRFIKLNNKLNKNIDKNISHFSLGNILKNY